MPAGMGAADLVHDLRESLHDAAGVFDAPDDADFRRHLDHAASALAPVLRRTLAGTLTLVADQPDYAAPADLWRFKLSTWGAQRGQPWDKTWPGRLPTVIEQGGTLWLTPAPSAHQIAVLGASYGYFYYGLHTIDADAAQTTVPAAHRPLLLLRAQAEALSELAMRDTLRPVTVRDGFSGMPKTGTPGWLAEKFMERFEHQAQGMVR